MVGRAGRRNFDTLGNIVFYGLPRQKVKNFISSNIPSIKGRYTFDLNLLLQLSVINSYDNKSIKFLKSFVDNPIIRITNSDYDAQKCRELVRTQLNFLMIKKFLDSDFKPYNSVNLILPLRNFDANSSPLFVLHDLIQRKYFDKLSVKFNGNLDKLENHFIILLSHFIDVKYIPLVQRQFSSIQRILLPELDDLKEFLVEENLNLLSYLDKLKTESVFSLEISEIKKAFPVYYTTIYLPKNSYIYDYYLNPNLDLIDQINNINESRLYYAYKSLRIVLAAIKPHLWQSDRSVFAAFCRLQANVLDKFKKITN
jgi:hypothetical protein